MATVLPTPLLIYTPFGVTAENPEYITVPIPVPSQTASTINKASFDDGFPPATFTPEASGGLPFFGQDLNGILWMITAYIANFAAGNFSQYSSAQSTAIGGYPLGSLMQAASGKHYWLSTTTANTTNPDTGGAGWVPVLGYGNLTLTLANANVTLTAEQISQPMILLTGTVSGNITISFPTTNAGQEWLIINEASGSGSISVATVAGGTPLAIPQTGGGTAYPTVIYCDGTNLQYIVVSTTGLAPLNSPMFTGVPTAPTPPITSNTTQLATTAFVQALIAADLAGYAPLASPTFSGVPTAPTQASTDSSTKIATTAFVKAVAGITGITKADPGGVDFGFGLSLRWGTGVMSGAGTQSFNFATPFPTAAYVVVASVASSFSVEFFTTIAGSLTATGFQQYSNAATSFNYVAIGS
jgi:hypothetical protein